jgi:hypothetical protein
MNNDRKGVNSIANNRGRREVCRGLTSGGSPSSNGRDVLRAAGSQARCFLQVAQVGDEEARRAHAGMAPPSQQLRCDFPVCSDTKVVDCLESLSSYGRENVRLSCSVKRLQQRREAPRPPLTTVRPLCLSMAAVAPVLGMRVT